MKDFKNRREVSFDPLPSRNTMGHDFIAGSASQSVVEEKVAHLSLQLNQIIIKPYLQQALDYLKSSKFDAINAYNRLSDQIGNEVRIINLNIEELTNKIASCNETINRTQEVIRNKYSNATEEEISSGALNLEYEYNIVAEHYELSLQLSQEISKYKSRIDNLLSTQGMLDESSVPAVNRIQLEIDNLELLLHNLDSTDYAEALAKKQGRKNIVDKKEQRKPALTGRQEALADYAQKLSSNTIKNINSMNQPDVGAMNRYEDPTGLSINRKQYPFESDPMKEQKSAKSKHGKVVVDAESTGLLSREEMRLQKKLYKQQQKLRKMQMMNDYQLKMNELKAQQEAYAHNANGMYPVQQEEAKKALFSKKNKNESGRFSNIEEEEAIIASTKNELDNYSSYLSEQLEKNHLNAFEKEISEGLPVKVIR